MQAKVEVEERFTDKVGEGKSGVEVEVEVEVEVR